MLSKNQKLLAFSMLSSDASFSIGVFVVFMLALGLSLAQVSVVVAAYLISSALFEIPAGVFADRFGNKFSILIGSILMSVGFGLFAFAQGFYWFLVGYSLMGAGSAMKNGADVALLYSDLTSQSRASEFKKIYGSLQFKLNLFWVVASVSGGFLYVLNPRIPFLIEFALSIVTLLSVSFLSEKVDDSDSVTVIEHLKQSFRYAIGTPVFSKIFVFSALIGSVAVAAFQYLQPLYLNLGIDPRYFGMIAAMTFVFRALGSLFANQIGKWFSVDKYLVLHSLIFTLFLILFAKIKVGAIIFMIVACLYFLRGLYAPTITTFINERVTDSNRSTMLSVNSQFLTIFSSLLLFLSGVVSERYDLSVVFFVLACLSNAFLILYVLSLRNVEAG